MNKPIICTPIEVKKGFPSGQLECSNCRGSLSIVTRSAIGIEYVYPIRHKYCPNCGFKILWEQEGK